MKWKKTMAAGAAALVFAGSAFQASAAEVNADYLNALKESGAADLILDVEAYRSAYSDLEAVFGDNTEAYIAHYLTTGVYEGRTKGVLFNPLAYAEAYSDVKESYGDDISAIINHYVFFGIAENRTEGTAGSYSDIAEAEHAAAQENSIVHSNVPGSGSTAGSAVSSSSTGSVASSSTGSTTANAGSTGSSSSSGKVVDHTTSIYSDDYSTLLRVEYYDSSNQMFEYSVVSNYDGATRSYTEYIYSCSTCSLLRTNTYVNGALVSSVPN